MKPIKVIDVELDRPIDTIEGLTGYASGPHRSSVVSHAVCSLSKTALARRYLAIMSSALAVQTKGFGLLL